MSHNAIQGRTALVTGASSGLGTDFARELAARGASLILVARREELLEQLAAELRERYRVTVAVIAMDLGTPTAPQELYDQVAAAGLTVDILINNAGFGMYGRFLELDLDRERQMLELNMLALVALTRLFARPMVERRWGMLLQVASIGAYQPSPLYAAYGATKSFVLNFGEALNEELKGSGVSCTVISPGITATEFLAVAGQQPTLFQRLTMMTSASVARMGIQRMLRGTSSFVPGWINTMVVSLNRILPRSVAAKIAYRSMQ